MCSAKWMTDHEDSFYGLVAACDQPDGHGGDRHEGPVETWDGNRDTPAEGVRLSWPVGASTLGETTTTGATA